MIRKCIFNRSGITLLETMIALLIFSIGVLGVATMQVCSMYNNSKARRATSDSVAASKLLETILSLPYADPLLTDADDGYAPSTPDHGPFNIASSLSTIEWEVDDHFPVSNCKRISITVRRTEKKGISIVFKYNFFKAKGMV